MKMVTGNKTAGHVFRRSTSVVSQNQIKTDRLTEVLGRFEVCMTALGIAQWIIGNFLGSGFWCSILRLASTLGNDK